MKIWFDTEFYEFQPIMPHPGGTYKVPGANAIQLISIGAVREDGETFYAENSEFDWKRVPHTHWLHANVRPRLTGEEFDVNFIKWEFLKFAGVNPEFWAWYADYDWVVLCGLYGRMVDLPAGWPMYCKDLKQLTGNYPLPLQSAGNHNALEDAKWNKYAYEYFMERQ